MSTEDIIYSQNNLFKKEEIEQSVTKRFEYQVGQHPEHLAIKSRTQQITYHALNAKANQLARALLALQPDRTKPIVLLLEQGVAFITALLAVLKIGRIYVPLDASFPYTRNAYILEDAQATLIVTNTKNLTSAQTLAQNKYTLFNIDDVDATCSSENLANMVSPDALAYLIYTSGSTGQPKGVIQNHRNILHNCMLQTQGMQIIHTDRMSLLYSCSVMGAARNIFNALLNGATLYPFNVKSSGLNQLVDWVIREEITIYHSVVTLFRHVVSVLTGQEALDKLRLIILGGEAVLTKDAELYKKHFPATCTLYTALGATETGTARQFIVKHDTPLTGPVVPLGYAVADKDVLLLDEAGVAVKPGEIGEIAVRSRYLALGYWRKPELTEKAFTPDPQDQHQLIYHTGDMGLMLADGCLLHKGRKDFQVKIRGYRIEIAEIEALLLNLPQIKEAVVTTQENANGEKYLVAYFVPESNHSPTLETLHRHLADKLPDYMLPAAFVCLEALPLTPNGKVNRLALPLPEQVRPRLDNTLIAPRTDLEEKLVAIWSDILQRAPIGIHDNFFQLGGHSLFAAQVILRINHTFAIELPLSSLFEAPTIAHLAKKVDQFAQQGKTEQFIPVCDRKETLPLSFAQQRLWFLDQLEPSSSFYHITKAVRITGHLEVQVLQAALNHVVARHEILRTTLNTVDGNPYQRIAEKGLVALSVIKVAPTLQTAAQQRLLQAEIQRPFDLSNDLMLRATLWQLSPTDSILLLVMHHIAADGWSVGILFHELTTLYEAFSQNQPSPLPALPIQYVDFAVWQRQWLQGITLQQQLDYWTHQLADIPAQLTLFTDHPRPAVQTFRGCNQRFHLEKPLVTQLHHLSQQAGVTLFMTLLAAFMILLNRYSHQTHLTVGSPIANRTRPEIESLIGFFVNTLVLRGDLSDNPTFLTFLSQIKQTCLAAYTHQDLPFEKLVEVLQPERDLSYSPLFQVMFVLQNAPREALHLSKVTMTALEITHTTAKFDWLLAMEETETGTLEGNWEYNTDLFEATTITRIISQFQTLLAGIVANPQQQVFRLPLLDEQASDQLWFRWNQTTAVYPQEKTLSQWFEEQATQAPEAIAVILADQQLTYRALNQQANQLAHYLHSLGIQPDDIVGVYLARSIEMVISILGILKAGAAYLPLDLSYPQERLAFMLEDAQAAFLLTQQTFSDQLPRSTTETIYLDTDQKLQTQACLANLPQQAKPHHLAYVIYTSGSTGQPKGVAMPHQPLVNLTAWQLQNTTVSATARTLQFSPISFDVSCQEMFATWCAGGTLVLIPEEERRDMVALLNYLAHYRIERLFLPFIALQHLAEIAQETQVIPDLSLREIITAGEQLQITPAIAQWLSQLTSCTLYNQYGPSETHVVTAFKLEGKPTQWPTLPPIGRPIANAHIYILDTYLQPTPLGVAGELYIGGVSLARGYLNQPDLTAIRFITHPKVDSERLYKTGDLARYLPNGHIEYLGRTDNQVKIRGFRIELGEIETALTYHPTVKAAAVIVQEDAVEQKRLIAYLVPQAGCQLDFDALRYFLAEKLPEYMLPAFMTALAALPLTPSGKVDRRALPAPDFKQLLAEKSFVAPQDTLERKLAAIWSQILGIQPIGRQDHFFNLGGHSLLAVKLSAQVEKVLKCKLPVMTIFQAPTLMQQARILREAHYIPKKRALEIIQPQGSAPPFFFIGSTAYTRELAPFLGREQPVYGLNLFGLTPIKNSGFHLTVKGIAEQYLREIQTVQPKKPYRLGAYCGDAKVALEVAQQLYQQGHSVDLLAFIDVSWQPECHSNRLSYFWRSLLKFGPGYLHYRTQRRIKFTQTLLLRKLSRFRERFHRYIKHPVPSQVQHLLLIQAFYQALRAYKPQVYPGRITLFLSSEWRFKYSLTLEHIAQNGLEVYEVEGYHDNLFTYPQSEQLAMHLRRCLESTG